MRPRRRVGLLVPFCWMMAVLCATLGTAEDEAPAPTLDRFADRVAVARQGLPHVIEATEAAAARKLQQPDTLINVPYGRQPSFAEEVLNRSGGLAGALPSIERRHLLTDHDIVLFSIRSWEKDGEDGAEFLKQCREKGWFTILFASAAGKPEDLEVDYLIDNGAPDGGEDEATVNVAANALNGWLWVCEYTSAMSRSGKRPGFLQSITTPGSSAHNAIYQDRATRHHIYDCETAIPPGDLARIYLGRVDRLLRDLHSRKTQKQLDRAADLIAERLRSEKEVFVSTNTHLMLSEIYRDNRSPWKPIRTLRRMSAALEKHVEPEDLFFWLGFNGVSIWWYPPGKTESALFIDYDTPLRESGVDLITCFATDPLHSRNNGRGSLAHVEQDWSYGDAEVPVPFPPGRIAPISGLYQCLLYRMLDGRVAAKLAEP